MAILEAVRPAPPVGPRRQATVRPADWQSRLRIALLDLQFLPAISPPMPPVSPAQQLAPYARVERTLEFHKPRIPSYRSHDLSSYTNGISAGNARGAPNKWRRRGGCHCFSGDSSVSQV